MQSNDLSSNRHDKRFKGRVAVITGGASGIGKSCAQLLAAEGAKVVIADINQASAEIVAREVGGWAYAVDVCSDRELASLVTRIEKDVGDVTALINAAGIIQGAAVPPAELPLETYDQVFNTNLRGTYVTCAAFGSRMALRRHGVILNIASISGMLSTPLHAYGPMKAAIIQLTQNLATEWGRSGVRVNCVSPGPVLTPALQTAIDKGQRDLGRMEQSTAIGRMVMPNEVAMAAAFLLSDDALAITGVNLPVDNGWLLAGSWSMFGGVRPA